VRQLLTESEARLAAWRAELREALGINGGVLVEVLPEIAFIVGPQPAPAPLAPAEAHNRFQRVLVAFRRRAREAEHPLVLFLDDLQWADAATLGLFEPLLASDEIRGLLLIGAYRDHELDRAPQLTRTVDALEASGVGIRRIALGPLPPDDVARLVADTLACGVDEAAALAQLVHRKDRRQSVLRHPVSGLARPRWAHPVRCGRRSLGLCDRAHRRSAAGRERGRADDPQHRAPAGALRNTC
jgi:predicted ATPase